MHQDGPETSQKRARNEARMPETRQKRRRNEVILNGSGYTVDMCLRRREAVNSIEPWIDGEKRWIIRYEASNSFNHC
jgi:hypothetical protein